MAQFHQSLLKYLCILSASVSSTALIAQPLADFKATPIQGCNPLKVDFLNTSTGAVAYTWAFGNGNSSSLVSPSAVYNTPGKFSVTLIATDAKGVSDTLFLKDYITVFRTPKAAFTVQKQLVCAGDTARFLDASTIGDGPIKTFKWDFGNGGISFLKNPTYVYASTGSYDITYAITDTNGCSSSVKVPKFMQANAQPTASFTSDKNFKCQSPVTIKFSASAQGTGPLTYSWSFGDGGTGSGPKLDHTYNNLGAYPVTLNVTDGNGCIVKVQKPDFIQIKEPTVDFLASQLIVCEGQKVGFQNQSLPIDGAGRFHWDFGNGDTSSAVNPEVTFKKAGEYSVSLTYYWDKCVVTKTKTAYIRVSGGVVAAIQPRDTAICRSNNTKFPFYIHGQDFNKIIWHIKGKDIETDASGTYNFPLDTLNGKYTIKATIISSTGCKSITDSTTITLRGPKARIGIDKTQGCIPYGIDAWSLSSGDAPIVSYKWTGQGQNVNSTKSSVSFTNNTFGITGLELLVTDANGCMDLTAVMIGGGVKVDSKFDTDKKVICSNEPFTLYNLSKQKHPDTVVFLYSWTDNDTIMFPPGRDSTKFKFRHKQSNNVKLTFTATSYGCVARSSLVISVLGAFVDGTVKVLCVGDSLVGTNKSTDYTSTFWKYENENKVKQTSSNMTLVRPISKTSNLWLHAYNSVNNCKDSLPFPLKLDPQDASFVYNVNCGSGLLEAKNGYIGLDDTMFTWILTNTATKATQTSRSRDFKSTIKETGSYKLQLQVTNKLYQCTKPYSVNFTVRPVKNMRGDVTLDRTTCYPVNFTLKDQNFQYWKSAQWVIGGEVQLADSAKTISYNYTSNKTDLEVLLVKTDSLNCSYTDTFKYKIDGMKAGIGFVQDNTNCLSPICRFETNISPIKANTQYHYYWDFGYKKSRKYADTVRLNGPGTITATLLVTESTGCQSIATKTVDVKVGKPTARFVTHDTLMACPPLNITFIDSSVGGFGPITSRQWEFGDMTQSDKVNPGKLYIVPGKYTVSLIVTNTSNCKDTYSMTDLVVVKGPIGTYSIDNLKGCAPFKVGLKTDVKGQVSKFDFDMGDGNVFDKGVKNHVYKQPGVYIPRLILIDSAGCKYSPEPTDTVRVYATPVAMFSSGPICQNQLYKIPHTTVCPDSVNVSWFNNAKHLSSSDTLPLFMPSPGRIDISLKVVSEHNCADSITQSFESYGIRPSVTIPKEEYCLGDEVKITDRTTSDTTIIKRTIWVGGEMLADNTPWSYLASKRGKLPLALEFTDALGCKARVDKGDFIRVGDTLPPPALNVYRTSVVDNVTTETKFNSSVEPDFKDYNLYIEQNGLWKPMARANDLFDTLVKITGLKTLNESYCHLVRQRNFCGVLSDSMASVKHCTIETKAVGDTNASVVNWSPYVGWNNVKEYRIWRKQKEETSYILLAVVPGSTLNYIDTAIYCNVEYDFKIEGREDGGAYEYSNSDTSRSKPIHVNSVPAPEVWRTTVEANEFTHTEWIMPVKSKYPIAYYSVTRLDGTMVSTDAPIQVKGNTMYFDDYNTDVQNRNYTYTISATDVCSTSSFQSNVGRNIVLKGKSSNELQDPELTWTPYIYWNEGVQDYRVERSLSGGAFEEIGRVGGDELTFTDHTLPKHCEKQYEYRVIATRNQPASVDSSHSAESVSNQFKYEPEIRFFIPNAFTPNNNNLNEGFHPDGVYFSGYEMKIYNRYGQKIYEGSDCMNSWDGTYNGENATEGVYAYYIEAWDVAGKSYKFNGTIHLLR